MKIATWNIERLKYIKELKVMQEICNSLKADIFVLTESDDRMILNKDCCVHSDDLDGEYLTIQKNPLIYSETEKRISIYTDYKCIKRYDTFDNKTALCLELETNIGSLIVYGVIIGIFGNRHKSFNEDLDRIKEDIKRLSNLGKPLCVCGDFNCSFSDGYYYTRYGREALMHTFNEAGMTIVTAEQPECIDHIAISDSIISGNTPHIEEWNIDKKLSDHKGIAVSI